MGVQVMSKYALIGNGIITDVAATESDKFEIKESPEMFWMKCPNEVFNDGTWAFENDSFTKISTEIQNKKQADIARTVAYGDIGDQLAMMYADQLNGTTTWLDHINNVRDTTVSPSTF